MSLINKIELSNFLDKSGGTDWTPTYRHNVLNLRGQNTAIVLMNGSGKTTIATAFLAVLSRRKSLVSTMRKVFSPSSFGVYTHFRIEFIQQDMRTSIPTLPTIGTTVTGETYVFGVCGHKDDQRSLKFYCYPGTLDDVPVVEVNDGSTDLLLNKEFEEKIRAKNGARYSNITVDEWLDRVHDHCGAQQLNQMVSFLQDGGGDKSASLYNTRVPRGKKFHECFFYTHIAPQLTIGEATTDAEKGEIFLDDTIVNSSLNIVDAQIAGEKKEERLRRKRKVTQIFLDIQELRGDIIKAESKYAAEYKKIADVAATLKHLVLDDPLPGIPQITSQENEVLLNLLKSIVIVPDLDEPFLMKDSGLAQLLNKNVREINQTFQRKSISQAPMSQHLDIACDLETDVASGGHKTKLYSLNSVLDLFDLIEVDYLKSGGSRADKETLKELIKTAFELFETKCDTNPIRSKIATINTEIRATKSVISGLESELKKLEEKKVSLEENIQLLQTNKIAYENMQKSGLFTEEELADPEKTKQELKNDADSLEGSRKEAENQVKGLHAKHELYLNFQKEFPMESPDSHLQVIVKEEKRLTDLIDRTKKLRDSASAVLVKTETALRDVDAELQVTNQDYTKIAEVQPGYLSFIDAFQDEDPIGYEKRIRDKENEIRDELTSKNASLTHAEKEYASELEFYSKAGEVDPSQWLSKTDEERKTLIHKEAELNSSIVHFNDELALLKQNKIGPGVNASRALKLIPEDVSYQELHSFVKKHSLSPTHAERFLTLFSSLLFAPVVESSDDITTILDIFTHQSSEEILLPVFHQQSLLNFLTAEDDLTVEISRDHIAYLIAGRKTAIVECILDSEKIEERRSFVEGELKRCKDELFQISEKLAEVSSNSVLVILAQKAKASKDKQLHLKVPRLKGEIEALEAERKVHTERFTEEVIDSIKSAEKFLNLGGPDTFSKLYDQQVLQQKRRNQLASDVTEQRRNHKEYSQQYDKSLQEQTEFHASTWERKHNLVALQEFIPDGLEEYKKAELHVSSAEKRLKIIRQKQDHELSKAAGYVLSLAISGEEDLVKQYAEIDSQTEIKRSAIFKQGITLRDLTQDFKQHKKFSQQYDQFVISINNLFKKALKNIREIENTDEIDLSMTLAYSAELRRELLQSSIDYPEVHEKSEQIQGLLENENFDVLNSRVSAARNKVLECERIFLKKCEKVASTSSKDNILNTGEINLIQEIKQTPEKVNHWAKVFEQTLLTDEKDLNTGRKHEEKLRNTLARSLTALTDKATGNLRILKQVLQETKDSASYSIECNIANRDSIETSIDEMVEMVKTAHQEYHRKKDDPMIMVTKTEEEDHKRSLKERVSEKCYRSIFLNPVITYRHPDIRGGHVTKFNIDKNYKGISEGEKTSLALLMQVVMARYSQKRKFLEEVGLGIRKRRDAAEAPNVLLIDGLFSSLSRPSLINQAFRSIKSTHGAFQIIGLIHNTTYVSSHDFEVFPNLFVGRAYTDISNNDDNDSWIGFEKREKEMAGQMAFANFKASTNQ